MKAVFADTFYWTALTNPEDNAHLRAAKFSRALAPFTKPEAEEFFKSTLDAVERGDCVLFGAFRGSQLVGTVQLLTKMPPNQSHRAEIAKLLVLRSARGQGIARRLMDHAETVARALRKSLLVLDTATGSDAERLYVRLGWEKAGMIPKYALLPDGTPCDTSIFWKALV